MKTSLLKRMLSFAAVAGLALGANASIQELTVADGTATSNQLPVYGYNWDCIGVYTHFIYPADDLADMAGKVIKSVTFYGQDQIKFSGGTQSVSLKEVEETTIGTRVTDGLTEVFNGTLAIDGDKLTVTFSGDGYEYQGGNLLIKTETLSRGTYKEQYFLGVETTGAGLYYYNYSSGVRDFLPKATFAYEGETPEYSARVSTTALDFGTLPENNLPGSKTVTLSNKGLQAFTPNVTLTGDGFSTSFAAAELAAGESVEIPVEFNAAIGEYAGTMTIDCGQAGQFEVALSGNVIEAVYEVTVADGNATSTNFPLYTLYWDSNYQSQVIYNKDMLSYLAGKEITRIKYYPGTPSLNLVNYGGEATIKMGVTDNKAFASSAKLDDSEFTTVGTWTPTGDGALEIELSTPYLYDGNSNLVVHFEVSTTGSGWQSPAVNFIGQQLGGTEYISCSSNSGATWNRSTFMPKTTFGYRDAQDEPVQVSIAITPEGGTYYSAQTITITTDPAELPEGLTLKYQITPANGDTEGEWVAYTEPFVLDASALVTAEVFDANGEPYAGSLSMEQQYDILIPEITVSPEFGAYEGTQTVQVTVTNMPNDGVISYLLEPIPTNGAMMAAPAEETPYDAGGIEVTQSSTLTIYVRDAQGAELANVSGRYIINETGTGVDGVVAGKPVKTIRYYNVAGQQVSKADGVSIMVIEFEDGTKTVSKVVK